MIGAWVQILFGGVWDVFWFTSENVRSYCLQYSWCISDSGKYLYTWYISLFGVSTLAYDYYLRGTSDYILVLIHQVIYCAEIGQSLITCVQLFSALLLVWSSHTSGSILDLAQAATPNKTDVCSLAYIHVCSTHQFLSAAQLRNQCVTFSISDGCKSLLSPKSILLLPYLLLYLFIWEPPWAFIEEWILKWKHRDNCFPMWCRFSSVQVYIVILKHHRGHM